MSKGIYKISRNEGFTLMHYGLINISQMFLEQEYTKKIDTEKDIEYPEKLTVRHSFLVSKCKSLRQSTSKMGYKNTYGSTSSILRVKQSLFRSFALR